MKTFRKLLLDRHADAGPTLDRLRREALDAWIRYHDAAGYVLLGDPVMKLVMA